MNIYKTKQSLSTLPRSRQTRTRAWSAIGAGVILFTLVCVLATLKFASPQKPQTESQPPTLLSYANPTLGISFQYPANLRLVAKPEIQTDGTKTLELDFFKSSAGEQAGPREASFTLIDEGPATSEPFPETLKRLLKDDQGMIPVHLCSFAIARAECLELGDQDAWVTAGNFPRATTIYLRNSARILGVSHGQNDSFSFSTTMIQILATLNF